MQIPAEHFKTDNDPSTLVVPDTISEFELQRWLDAEAEWLAAGGSEQ